MTERLYYSDPYCRHFDAVVLEAFDREGRPVVVLDRTAFYPTSGGQPFDTGRLADIDVLETLDLEHAVAHVMAAPLEAGATVTGEVDWARRFDHMQQHTGQHLLSAAFDRLFDNPTMSFHMGVETSTIDLQKGTASADVEAAVDEASRIVWEDRAVSIRFVTTEEVAELSLRKEPAREGTLRLIDVEGYDLSACGGTHVTRTGAVGLVAVVGTERVRGGTRVTFVCGARALRALRTYRDSVAGAVRLLSVVPADLPGAVERLQAESKAFRKALTTTQESLAVHEAARLLAGAQATGSVRVVACVIDGWDATGLKAMASAMAASGGVAVALVSSSVPAVVVVARSADVTLDSADVLRALVGCFGGRGGGKSDLAQGGGLSGDAVDIAHAARGALEEAVGGPTSG